MCDSAGSQVTVESLDLEIDPRLDIHYADLKPQVNAYVQQLIQAVSYTHLRAHET